MNRFDRFENYKIDLGGIKTSNFLDVGIHNVHIFDVEGVEFDNQNKPYVTYTFKAFDGRIHTERYYMNKDSLWKFKLLALAAGFPENSLLDPSHLIGKRVMITLVKKPYNGKDYINIDRVERLRENGRPVSQDLQAPPVTEDDFRDYPKNHENDPFDFV